MDISCASKFVVFLVALISANNIGELARKRCEQYSKYINDKPIFPFGHENYGVARCDPIVPLIVGGSRADRTEFPHFAHIGYGSFIKLEYLCGGSLISELFIMTAAHCAKNANGPALAVRLGSTSLLETDDHTHIVGIAQIYSHPEYNSKHKYNDIALMRLKRHIYFTEFIRPACININIHVEWSKAIAIGFGFTSHEHMHNNNHLLKVELDKIPLELCKRTFIKNGIKDSQFCAGDLVGNKDTCQGDSGGPLQILLAKPHCEYSIIGITSYGKACGFKNVPAVYTNVQNYTSWIEEVVWKHID